MITMKKEVKMKNATSPNTSDLEVRSENNSECKFTSVTRHVCTNEDVF
jgi:hypothetical protein